MSPTRKLNCVLTLLFACSFAPAVASGAQRAARAAAASAPAATVRAFYRFHLSHDTAFAERNVRLRRHWLEPRLYRLLLFELHRPTPPDEPPYMEGDPFTNSQETPQTFRTGVTTIDDDGAQVETFFLWTERSRVLSQRRYLVHLRRSRGRWLISNITDEGGEDLLKELQRMK